MAETQKPFKKIQDEYNYRKNSLSSEQSNPIAQIDQKKGFFASLWPILSLSNFLDNYNRKCGLLYVLFHPKEDYQKGKGIVFPVAVNYFTRLAKRVSTKFYREDPSEKVPILAPLLIDEISESSLFEKRLKLKKLEQLINKGLNKFKQLSDEKSIHKRNLLFAIKQFLKDSNSNQLEAAKLLYPRWDESSNLFGSQIKALIDSVERLHKEIRSAESLTSKQRKEEPQKLSTIDDSQLIRPKHIERIVCSGGGAKGVVYSGSYKAMVDTGVFAGVKELSGASAGAITAALMAVGMENHSFRSQLLTTNFKDLMGSAEKEVGPGVSFVFGKTITQTGAPLLEFIERNINTSVKINLKKVLPLSQKAGADDRLVALITKIENQSDDKPSITFGELALLNKHFSEYFKQLVIPAVRYPNGEIQVFNSTSTPDVEIALACRASASLPVILKPQAIIIDGEEQLFVDGGLYDNLPTDYFDSKAGQYVKNKKPDQTLVFAFGEGLYNNKNQVFQALYGQRVDETISAQLVETIIDSTIKQIKIKPKTREKAIAQFKQALGSVLDNHVKQNNLTPKKAEFIKVKTLKAIENLLSTPKSYPEFWKNFNIEAEYSKRIPLLGALVKDQMKPILYAAGANERLKRDVLVGQLGGLKTPYLNTARKELGYQKLRSDYALRTVELRVGTLKTTDFIPATKLARVMDALGYLDTVNHISNNELHNSNTFNPAVFYSKLVKSFESIYQAVQLGAGHDPAQDKLLSEINSLRFQLGLHGKSESIINRQVYQLIKDHVEKGLDSAGAFALSRAVEFNHKTLSSEALLKETYEQGFKRAGIFAISNITGERTIRSSSLHDALADKNMFELYDQQPANDKQSRTDKIFTSLSELERFKLDYEDYHENEVQVIRVASNFK